MRKLSVLWLLTLHLLANTEFAQIFRLPSLVAHFQYHRQQDPGMGFLHFLALHYGGDDGDPTDNAAENQLPCHNYFSEHSYQHTVYSYQVNLPDADVVVLPPAGNVSLADHRLLPGFGRILLQPPRLS